jgi:hypothetical protein
MLPFLLLLLVAPALGQEVGTLTVTAPTELVPQAAALPEPEGAVQTGDGVERAVRVFNLTSLLISDSDPNRLRSTDCDVNPAASVPTLNVAGGWYSATTCINAASNRLQLQAVVRNPSGFNSFGLYIGNGAQCPSSSATLWNPNDFSWTSSNSYTGQTAAVFRASQCTSNVACCAVIVCNNIAFNCADMTAAVSFIQNPLPTTCGGSNLGLSRIPSGSLSRAIGCTLSGAITNGTTQDFSVTNPNRHTLTVWVTDGTGPLGCGLPDTNPTGAFSYNFYQRRVDTTATSISFSGVQCNSTQCCAIILCSGANDFGCYGISYSQAISRPNRPPPAAPAQESARSLAAGIVVAIVIGALVVSCAAAFYVRRKYHSGAFDTTTRCV